MIHITGERTMLFDEMIMEGIEWFFNVLDKILMYWENVEIFRWGIMHVIVFYIVIWWVMTKYKRKSK